MPKSPTSPTKEASAPADEKKWPRASKTSNRAEGRARRPELPDHPVPQWYYAGPPAK